MDTSARSSLLLWVAMNRASARIADHLRKQVEEHGLSFTEFAVLEALLHKGALALGEIGNVVLRTSGSMTYVIDKLEKRGLIERRRCETDRRILYADLTKSGRDKIEEVFPGHAILIGRLMSDLRKDEQQLAARMMVRLERSAAADSASAALAG